MSIFLAMQQSPRLWSRPELPLKRRHHWWCFGLLILVWSRFALAAALPDEAYRLREAQLLSRAGRLQSAAEAYQSLLKDFPANQEARTGYGLTLYWRGDWQGAEKALAEVLRAEPKNDLAFHTSF